MLYAPEDIQHMRRCRNHLLWAIAVMLLIVTPISFFYALDEGFRRHLTSDQLGDVMLNPFMVLALLWIAFAFFRLARSINHRAYFWLPAMILLVLPFIGLIVLVLLIFKASGIISRKVPPPAPATETQVDTFR
jgi:hypothetical protein